MGVIEGLGVRVGEVWCGVWEGGGGYAGEVSCFNPISAARCSGS